MVQKDGPIRSVRDLKGRKVGITQLGSTFHYMLGNLLEQEGLSLADVEPAPLRTLGAMAEALQARRVDAVLIPQPFAGTAVENGSGRILFWVGDKLPYQVAAIFYSKTFAQDRERAVAFMKGYVKAARLFFDAVLAQKDGKPPAGPAYDEVVNVTARYTGATPEIIRVGFPYQDRDGAAGRGRHRPPAPLVPQGRHDHGAAPDQRSRGRLVPRGGATRASRGDGARRASPARAMRRGE